MCGLPLLEIVLPHKYSIIKKIAFASLLSLVAASAVSADDKPNFSPRNTREWRSELHINWDNTLDVVDRITQNPESAPLVTIDRVLHDTYKDRYGNNIQEAFEVKEVTDGSGNPLQFHVSTDKGSTTIHVDLQALKSDTVVIHYVAKGVIEVKNDGSELLWTAVDTDWDRPIDNVMVLFYLPDGTDLSRVRPAAFRGSDLPGSAQAIIAADGIAIQTVNLAPHEGFSCYLELPPGSLDVVTPQRKLRHSLSHSWALLAKWWPSAVIPLLVLYIMFVVKWRSREAAVVGTAGEHGWGVLTQLSPYQLRHLSQLKSDVRGVFASLLDLAQRGYIGIERSGSEALQLVRVAPEPSSVQTLDAHERSLLDLVFASSPVVGISELAGNAPELATAIGPAAGSSMKSKKLIYDEPYEYQRWLIGMGILLAVLALWFSLIYIYPVAAGLALGAVVIFLFRKVLPFRTLSGSRIVGDASRFERTFSAAAKTPDKFAVASVGQISDVNGSHSVSPEFYQLVPYAFALDCEQNWFAADAVESPTMPNCYAFITPDGNNLSKSLLLSKLTDILHSLEMGSRNKIA